MAQTNSEEQSLKSALWYSIGKIVDEESLRLGINATPQFIGALTEMVWIQIENVSQDVGSFAAHAKRTKVKAEDIMLLTRRNEGLETVLRTFLDHYRASDEDQRGKKGKR